MKLSKWEKELLMKGQKEMGCHNCFYVDKKALGKGKPCCTYAFQIKIDTNTGKCLTRKPLKE